MKKILRIWTALLLAGAIFSAPAESRGLGFHFGGQFIVSPESVSLFSFGVKYDIPIYKDTFFFHTDLTLAVNGSYFFINAGLVGFRFAFPVMKGKLRPGFRANFLISDGIRFDPHSSNSFGLGAVFGPNVAFRLGKTFEVLLNLDLGFYSFVQAGAGFLDKPGASGSTQFFLNLSCGFGF